MDQYPTQQQLLEAIYASYTLGDQNASQLLQSFQNSPNSWHGIHSLFSLLTSPSIQLPLPLIHHCASLMTLDKVRKEWKGLREGKEEIKAMLSEHFNIILKSLQSGLYSSHLTLSHTILSNISEALTTIAVLDHSCDSLFSFATGELQALSPSIALVLLTALHDLSNSKKIHLGMTTTTSFESFLRSHSTQVLSMCESLLVPLLPLLNKDINPTAFTTLSSALLAITSQDEQPPAHIMTPEYANIEHITFSPFYATSSTATETYSIHSFRSIEVTSPLIPIRTYCQIPNQIPLHSIVHSSDLLFFYRHTPTLQHFTSLSSQHNFITLVLKCIYAWLPSISSISTLSRIGHGALLHIVLSLLPFDQYSTLVISIMNKSFDQRQYPMPSTHKQAVFIVSKVCVEFSLRLQSRMLYSWVCLSSQASTTPPLYSGKTHQYPHSHLLLHLQAVAKPLQSTPVLNSPTYVSLSQLPNIAISQPRFNDNIQIINNAEQYASIVSTSPTSLPSLIYNTYKPYFPQSSSSPEDIFDSYTDLDFIYKILRMFITLCTMFIEKDTATFITGPNPTISLTNFMILTLCHPQIQFSLSAFEYFTSIHDSPFIDRGYFYHQPLFVSVFIIIGLQLSYPGLALLWLFKNPDNFDTVAAFGSTQFNFDEKNPFELTIHGVIQFNDEKKKYSHSYRNQQALARHKKGDEMILKICDFLYEPNMGEDNVDIISRQYIQLSTIHPATFQQQKDISTFYQTFKTFPSQPLQQLTSTFLSIQYQQQTLLSSFSHISQFQLATMSPETLNSTILFDLNSSVEFIDVDCTSFSLFTPSFFTNISEHGLYDDIEQARAQFVNFVQQSLIDVYNAVDISILTFFLRAIGAHLPLSPLISLQSSQMQHEITQQSLQNDSILSQLLLNTKSPLFSLLSSSIPHDHHNMVFPSSGLVSNNGTLLDSVTILDFPTLNISTRQPQQQHQQHQQHQQQPQQVSFLEYYSYLEHLPQTTSLEQHIITQQNGLSTTTIRQFIPYSIPDGFPHQIYLTFTQSIIKLLVALSDAILQGFSEQPHSMEQILKDEGIFKVLSTYSWSSLEQHQHQSEMLSHDFNFTKRFHTFQHEQSILLQQHHQQLLSTRHQIEQNEYDEQNGEKSKELFEIYPEIYPQGYSIDFIICCYLHRKHLTQLSRIHTLCILMYHLIHISISLPTIPSFFTPSPAITDSIKPSDYQKTHHGPVPIATAAASTDAAYNTDVVSYIIPLSSQFLHLFISYRSVIPLLHPHSITSLLYLISQYIAASSQPCLSLLSSLIQNMTSQPTSYNTSSIIEQSSLTSSLLPYIQQNAGSGSTKQQTANLDAILTTLVLLYRTPQISSNGLYNTALVTDLSTHHYTETNRLKHLAPFSTSTSFTATISTSASQTHHTLQPTHFALFSSLAFSLICETLIQDQRVFLCHYFDALMFTSEASPLLNLIFVTFALKSIGIHIQTPEMFIMKSILPTLSLPNHSQMITKYLQQNSQEIYSSSQLLQYASMPTFSMDQNNQQNSTIYCYDSKKFIPLQPYTWTTVPHQYSSPNLTTYLIQLQNDPRYMPFLQHLSNLPLLLQSLNQSTSNLLVLPSNPYINYDIDASKALLQQQLQLCFLPTYLSPTALPYYFEAIKHILPILPSPIAHLFTSTLLQPYIASRTSLITSLEQMASSMPQSQTLLLLRYFTLSFTQLFLSTICSFFFTQKPAFEEKSYLPNTTPIPNTPSAPTAHNNIITGVRSLSCFYGNFVESKDTTIQIAMSIALSILPAIETILTPMHNLISTQLLTESELNTPKHILFTPLFLSLYPSSPSSSLSLTALQSAHDAFLRQPQSVSTTLSIHFTTPSMYYLLQSLLQNPSLHAVEQSPTVVTSYIQSIAKILTKIITTSPAALLSHISKLLSTLTTLPSEFNQNSFVDLVSSLIQSQGATENSLYVVFARIKEFSNRIEFFWSIFAHIVPIITSAIQTYGDDYATVPFFVQNITHMLNFIVDSLSIHAFCAEVLSSKPTEWFIASQSLPSIQTLPLNNATYSASIQAAQPLLIPFYQLLIEMIKIQPQTELKEVHQSISPFLSSSEIQNFPHEYIIKNKLLIHQVFQTFSYYNFALFATTSQSFLKDFYTLTTLTTMHCGSTSSQFQVLKAGLEVSASFHSTFNNMHQIIFFFLFISFQGVQYDPWFNQCAQALGGNHVNSLTFEHILSNPQQVRQVILSSHPNANLTTSDDGRLSSAAEGAKFCMHMRIMVLLIHISINTTIQLHQVFSQTTSFDQYDIQSRIQRQQHVVQLTSNLYSQLSHLFDKSLWAGMMTQLSTFILHNPVTTLKCFNHIKYHMSQTSPQTSTSHIIENLFQQFYTSDIFFTTFIQETALFQHFGPLQTSLYNTISASPVLPSLISSFPSISTIITLHSTPTFSSNSSQQHNTFLSLIHHLLATMFTFLSNNHVQDAASQQRLAIALSCLLLVIPPSETFNIALEFALIHTSAIPLRFTMSDRALLAQLIAQLAQQTRQIVISSLWCNYLGELSTSIQPSAAQSSPTKLITLFDPSPSQPQSPQLGSLARPKYAEHLSKQLSTYKSKLLKFERKYKILITELTTLFNHPTSTSLSSLQDLFEN